MSEIPDPAPRPKIVLAPRVRLGRILYRFLPWLGFVIIAVGGALALGVRDPAFRQIGVTGAVILGYGLLLALVTEVLSPDRADLRLIRVSDATARRVAAALRFLLFFLLFTGVGAALLEANRWHVGLADLLRVVRNVVLILAAWVLLSATGVFRWMTSGKPGTFFGTLGRYASRVLMPLVALTALFVVIATGAGYVPLAYYVIQNAAWTALILGLAVMLYKWLRSRLYETVHFYRGEDTSATAEGDTSERSTAVEADPVALGTERVGGGILLLLIMVGTFFWVLAQWDMPPAKLIGLLGQPIVSGGELTWGQFIGGFVKVLTVVFLGWFLKNVLTYFVFPRSHMGVGARYAVLAVLRYAVIALTVVYSLAALGVDTASFGWFFGAAGIGIGFGLQDIIGNFISGLIMLIERPIRVGDSVQIGDAVGKVENIHMRGTVLRTFDNTTILIPNRQLLGERVTNLTYGMQNARVLIEVGVSYDSDPEQVKEILLGVAHEHPDIVDDPEPGVLFLDFADSYLHFRLVTHTSKVTGRFGVASELRTAIFERLGAAGIEIPFPQRDLHLKSGWPEGAVRS